MNYTKEALTYILLIIPVAFAVTVIAQGLQKMNKNEAEGKVAVGFGILFLLMIVTTYILFIR